VLLHSSSVGQNILFRMLIANPIELSSKAEESGQSISLRLPVLYLHLSSTLNDLFCVNAKLAVCFRHRIAAERQYMNGGGGNTNADSIVATANNTRSPKLPQQLR